MNSNQQATLNQAIKLLQSLLKNTGADSQSSAINQVSIPDYDHQISAFYQKGAALEPQIVALTDIYKKASNTMKTILSYSQICKKYSTAQQQKLKNIFITLSNDVDKISQKNPKFLDQCKAIKQILSVTFWVFVPTPEMIVKGGIEGADFNARKFQILKNKQHNDWWAAISGACKALDKHVVKNNPMGLNFQFNGQDKWNQIISGISSAQKSSASQKEAPTTNKPQQQSKPVVVPKAPKKQLMGLNWQYRYFQNQTINLANEIQMKHGIFIQNCTKCNIKIDSKFKSLNLNKCQNITLSVKGCISGIQIMNCKNITVVVKQKTPSISIDKSERININLNETNIDTDIVSCRVTQLNVTVQKSNGQQSKPHLISDQLITKWNPKTNKFQTKIYDKFL